MYVVDQMYDLSFWVGGSRIINSVDLPWGALEKFKI